MDRIKYRMTGSSILDKFSSLKGSERRRKNSRGRMETYQSLEELNHIQSIISRMPDHEANSKFEQMLDDMNLTEEKKAPLRQRTVAQKKAMLAMQCKGSIRSSMVATSDFIIELQRVPKMKGAERHEVVSSLRVALTNNPVSWVKDFAAKRGLNSVLKCLSYSCDDWEERRSTLECVKCLRAYSNNKFGLKQLIEHKDATTLLMRCVSSSSPPSSSSSRSSSSSCNQASLEAVKLLAALSLVPPDGLSKVLEGASICAEIRSRPRFASVVEGLSSTDLQMKLACLQLINAVISTPDHLDLRLHLRNEIFRTGLCDVISSLEAHSSEEVQRQVRVLMEHKEEDAEEFSHRYDNARFHMDDTRECFELLYSSTLNTPSEDYFLSILQHLLTIREDLYARPQYYQLIEECVSQIVLHRSGLDPDFRCSRRFQLDVEPLLGKLREEGSRDGDGQVGSRQLKGRLDEAVMAKQELEARSTALEEKVKAYEVEIKELRSKLNMDIGEAISSVIGIPPPPPISDPSIPPAPPLPGFGPPPPPGSIPAPPLAMMLPPRMPSFVKPKKKYQPSNQMKRANWTKINLTHLSKESFWTKADEDKYADDQLFERLVDNFAFKNIEKKDENDGDKQYRKAKELKVLDAKSAQNLSILLGSIKLPHEEIKRRILRMEDLNTTFVEQLLKLLPSQDVINKLAGLKEQHDSLTEPEQFGVVISGIRRLLPRLSSMLFQMRFNEVVAETKPELMAATEAMGEVMTSARFGELLKIILLFGNFMNAGSRNECTIGFELSYIPKIVNTKSRDNSKSLMHFLVEYVQDRHPHLLSFSDDFIHIDQAAKVSLDSLAKSISTMKISVKQLETDLKNARNDKHQPMPEDAFVAVMTPFLESSREQVGLLEGMHKAMQARYLQQVAPFFCLEASKYPLDEFLADVKLFVDHFQQSRVEIERRREVEAMQKKQKEMERRWQEERQMKKMRKKMLVDMHADDDQEGVMDNLLEALKTGSAFHMGRRAARKRPPRASGAERRAQFVHSRSRQSLLSPPSQSQLPPGTYQSPTQPSSTKPSPTQPSFTKPSPTQPSFTKPSLTKSPSTKASPKHTSKQRSKPSKTNSPLYQPQENKKSPVHKTSPRNHAQALATKKRSPLHTKLSPKQHNTHVQQQHNATTQQQQQQRPQKMPHSSNKSKNDSNIKTIVFHDDDDDDNENDENANKFSIVQGNVSNKSVKEDRNIPKGGGTRSKTSHSKAPSTNIPSSSSSPSSLLSSSQVDTNDDTLTSYNPGKFDGFDDLLNQLRAL